MGLRCAFSESGVSTPGGDAGSSRTCMRSEAGGMEPPEV